MEPLSPFRVRAARSDRVRLGLLANKLYAEVYGKKPKEGPQQHQACLEQACRELKGKAPVATQPLGTHNIRRGQTTTRAL
jgi:hypothetical protein